jgi:hypothetical protein
LSSFDQCSTRKGLISHIPFEMFSEVRRNAENLQPSSILLLDSLSEQETEDIISNPEIRTAFLVKSLVGGCKSRKVFRAAITRLVEESVIDSVDNLDALATQSIPVDDGSEPSTENELCDDEDLDDDIPDVDSLLQMEVFNSSAVKNIGRFNCEFLRYEKLGQGGFGCAYRVHHLVDEKDYCVKELHLSIQKFEGSMSHMIAYARGVLREVAALAHSTAF